jgi:oxygen-independent coproporphyrinogen III oxidase
LGYAYSYPHKTAYRPFTPPQSLSDVWAKELKEQLEEQNEETAFYLHIPFCEMRCGFCNLFTTPNPPEETEARYLEALKRQARMVREATGKIRCSRVAFGGGTPTFLTLSGLEQALQTASQFADLAIVPFSVETSPRTAERAKLGLLRQYGADRISIGVQSFIASEVKAVGRAQQNEWVYEALEQIRAAGFPTLNIDLMYGLPGQTAETWATTLSEALRWEPEELYLYPLYVRPLTGLDGKVEVDDRTWDAERLAFYRQARETLLTNNYRQVSLRYFAKKDAPTHPSSDAVGGNLIGLGCGARSYTRSLHYSSDWAVSRTGVRDIIGDYLNATEADFAHISYGVSLTLGEQKRRYLTYSLLQQAEGVRLVAYQARFGTDVFADFPHLEELTTHHLATHHNATFALTETGWGWADVLGPWLTSDDMRLKMAGFQIK